MPKPKVVGLDLSLTTTGFVSWDMGTKTETVKAIKAGSLRDEGRLAYYAETIVDLILDVYPTLVVIEGYGFGARQSRAHSLGELGGVVKLALHQISVPFAICPPSTLKKYVTGKGNAPKDTMIKEVYRRWRFDTNDNNIADAYGLARLGEIIVRPKTKTDAKLVSACDTTRFK